MAIIDKPTQYFDTVLWTGASDTTVSVPDFTSVDFAWIKNRSSTHYHRIIDRVRGDNTGIYTNATAAEGTYSVNDDCELGSSSLYFDVTNGGSNVSGGSMVAWCLNAGGTASSNTDGSITSSVSANTTSGFSIVSFTGNGSSAQTVGHGLNSAPEIIFTKNRIDANSWQVGSDYLTSWSYYVRLDTTGAESATGGGNVYGTAPTSTVFTVGSDNAVNGSSDGIISYCFHSVQGYSKFGSYTGGSDAFVYLGFKPSFIMFKNASAVENWRTVDNKRDIDNPVVAHLYPNLSNAEGSGAAYSDYIDFLSNGFKIRSGSGEIDGSGNTIIYMAFAENPFVTSTGVPATAR